jgi:hypothetical protein
VENNRDYKPRLGLHLIKPITKIYDS